MSELVQISRQDRVQRIALNRPEKRNALSAQLCRDLVAAIEDADRDAGVGAILLTGNGKHFCAGMDLSEVNTLNTSEINRIQERLFTIGSEITTPLVVAVRGAALGGGMGLVGNCHIVFAHPQATFGLTEIRIGLWPFLVFRVLSAGLGERRTLELSLTGRIFGVEEGREMGLVHEISGEPDERASETALALACSSPTTIRSGLTFVREARGKDWQSAGEIARRMRDDVIAGPDFREGQTAFLEKRTPRWPSLGKELR
jgi:enoyl-CoA hydratase/carnithine racemase